MKYKTSLTATTLKSNENLIGIGSNNIQLMMMNSIYH